MTGGTRANTTGKLLIVTLPVVFLSLIVFAGQKASCGYPVTIADPGNLRVGQPIIITVCSDENSAKRAPFKFQFVRDDQAVLLFQTSNTVLSNGPMTVQVIVDQPGGYVAAAYFPDGYATHLTVSP